MKKIRRMYLCPMFHIRYVVPYYKNQIDTFNHIRFKLDESAVYLSLYQAVYNKTKISRRKQL